ncbi:MAG: pyridoxamine 5'-phosphate oxidase family protein [Candidatus Omnitrophica bacterium]|nr:pyridoxamine 5'-phosphate oxidase family protein [Candidatus Omnitrophota bacterium]
MELPDGVIHFLERQGFVIVSTLDAKGAIHCSAKGIVGIEKQGRVFVIDLYKHKTFENLKRNPIVSISAVDEHKFVGYTIQGKAKIVPREDMQEHIVSKWEERILERISKRVASAVQAGVKSKGHFEVKLPEKPKYLIEIDVENIIDLAPPQFDNH